MSLRNKIDKLISAQGDVFIKSKEWIEISKSVLDQLHIPNHSEFYYFYVHYFAYGLKVNLNTDELTDPCPPQDMIKINQMANENWGVPKNYVMFSDGATEGGYLYNKEDGTVWDFTLGEQDLLGTDNLRHWKSFYEFLVWYLTPSE